MGLFGGLFKKEEKEIHPFEWYLDPNNSPDFLNRYLLEAARECCNTSWSRSKKTVDVSSESEIENLVYLEDCNFPRQMRRSTVSAEKLLLIALEREQYTAAFILGVFYEHGLFTCDGDKKECAEKYYKIARSHHVVEMNILDAIRKNPAALPGCATDANEKLAVSMLIYFSRKDLYNSISFFIPENYEIKFFKFAYSFLICYYASLNKYPLSKTLVSYVLANYENENGYINLGLFFDFFKFRSELRDTANIREMLATVCDMHDHGNKHATLSLINFGYIKPGTKPAYEVADNYDPVDDFENEEKPAFTTDDDSSSFPSYLYSSSDNTKTIYLVSSSYSNRATYRDDDGNYKEIIKRDGRYYDVSTEERYYQ